VKASSKEILETVIGPNEIHLYTNPEGEHDDFLKCVKSRKDPYFPVEIGHRVSSVCHLANIAIKTSRKLKWDPNAEEFIGDPGANALLTRPMRAPWKLEAVRDFGGTRSSLFRPHGLNWIKPCGSDGWDHSRNNAYQHQDGARGHQCGQRHGEMNVAPALRCPRTAHQGMAANQ
jgi:hypothetical protein